MVHLCRQASEWRSIGSQFFHTDNPQCNKRGVVSKTAPSPPKHDRPRANRTHFRHVSSCWLIPVCFRSRISKDTQSNSESLSLNTEALRGRRDSSAGAENNNKDSGRKVKGHCKNVIGTFVITYFSQQCAGLCKQPHSFDGGRASFHFQLNSSALTLSHKKHRLTSAIMLLIDLSRRNDQAECSTLMVHHVPIMWASKTGKLNAAGGVVAELTHRSWHTLS